MDTTLDLDSQATSALSVYWMNADPGAGKTVLATHVAALLEESRVPFSTHFFHFGGNASQSLAVCLRSIAYQMGKTNTEVCHALAKLQEDGCTFDPDDARSIWVKVFKSCIFQVSLLSSPISNAANKPILTQVAMSSPYY